MSDGAGINVHQFVPNRALLSRAFALLALMLCLCNYAVAQGRVSVTVRPKAENRQPVVLIVDGKIVEAESLQVLRGQQVMVWLRDLEILGWGKAESGKSGEVLFKRGDVVLSFAKNQGIAKVNSLAVQLPVDTYLRDGKLMVPMSFTAKALGFDCDVSIKTVATINTIPSKPTVKATNSLHGQVIYAGKGVEGVLVRAVDANFNTIKDAVAKTDSEGNFKIDGLADGAYMAYVYIADNPLYFNRASDSVTLSGAKVVTVKPLIIGKVILPVYPKPGAKVTPAKGKIPFAWSNCPEAASYELVIKKHGTDQEIARLMRRAPKADVQASALKAGAVYDAMLTALDANGNYLGGTARVGGNLWQFTVQATRSKP